MQLQGFILSFVTAVTIIGCSGSVAAEEHLFPTFPAIEANVGFWEKIYSNYGLSQGVIHDKDDLGKVYEVIDLLPREEAGNRKINRARVKAAKKKYKKILLHLARGLQPADLEEQRIYELFGANTAPWEFYRAAQKVRFQLGQKDRFVQGVVRSGAYLSRIKEIFRGYGLSEDLAYLPHVESSYNYKAYSKLGAAGIWQFTRSTGKRYMAVDYTIDERRDPIVATHAAAKLLKRNYEKLGSWPLAITAYNHGANGMLRAKRKHGDYETIFEKYNGKAFKFASRNFYSEFLAARNIARDHEAYFGSLDLDEPLDTFEIKTAGYVAVEDLGNHFSVELETLKSLNPALRPPVFLGQKYIPKNAIVRLPAATVEGRQNVEMAALIPEEFYKPSQRHSNFYRVGSGETASYIARRHRVSVQDLILANGLDSRATIYAGQNLRIPTSDEKPVLIASAAKKRVGTVSGQAVAQLAAVENGSDVELGGDETTAMGDGEQAEEQDEAAAGYVQASVVPFASWGDKVLNDLVASWKEPASGGGASVLVPHRLEDVAGVNSDLVSGNLSVEPLHEAEGKQRGVISVEAEETLGHYAEWAGVTAVEIRRLNRISYGHGIRIGQNLIVPLDRVSKEEFEERRYEYHKEMEEDFWGAYRVAGLKPYRVKRGENIWTLCESQFELPFWLVKKYNDSTDFSRLVPSQTIMVPVVVKIV